MGADGHIDWRQAAASALAWWDEAGVDSLVDEAPRDWLATPAPQARQPLVDPVIPAPVPAVEPDALPPAWDAFLAWRAGGAAPEAGWPGGWVAASGPADAALMVLVDCPDRGDNAEGLLSGAPGRLFDCMLAAIGLSRDAVHIAAVCAKRPTAGRTPADLHDRLAAIASHHIGLIAPERLLLLGNAASRAILATETREARGRLHRFNHDRGQTAVVASYHPRFLLEKPAAKAGAWADLQVLMKGSG